MTAVTKTAVFSLRIFIGEIRSTGTRIIIVRKLGRRSLTLNHKPSKSTRQHVRDNLFGNHIASEAPAYEAFAGKVLASFYRCPECDAWWICCHNDFPETTLVWRLVEPHSTDYLWQDYRGWHRAVHAGRCVNCAGETAAPEIVLRSGDDGQVIWPGAANIEENDELSGNSPLTESNPFVTYISQSRMINENITAIIAKEARRESNAWGYSADINGIRDEMKAMTIAFKDIVYSYAPILPPGWRVIADYDKWVAGQACAGFLHGEVQPDISLLIGGGCATVTEIEMELDRLHRYVCSLTI